MRKQFEIISTVETGRRRIITLKHLSDLHDSDDNIMKLIPFAGDNDTYYGDSGNEGRIVDAINALFLMAQNPGMTIADAISSAQGGSPILTIKNSQFHGPYVGYGDTATLATWKSQLDYSLNLVTDFLGSNNTPTVSQNNATNLTNIYKPVVQNFSTRIPLAWGPSTGPANATVTCAQVAAGAQDAVYNAIFNVLKTFNGAVFLSLGHEMNIKNHYPWAIDDNSGTYPNAANFVAAYNHVAGLVRAIDPVNLNTGLPSKLFLVYNPNVTDTAIDPSAHGGYPDNAKVDYIGGDAYDFVYIAGDKTPNTARWNSLLTKGFGLNALANLANVKGKRICLPEWGTGPTNDGACDTWSAYYIQQMAAWILSNNVVMNSYFNVDNAPSHVTDLFNANANAVAAKAAFAAAFN